jgi:hypothetical protein
MTTTPMGFAPMDEDHCTLYCHYVANQRMWGGQGGNIAQAYMAYLEQEGRTWSEKTPDPLLEDEVAAVAADSKAAKTEAKRERAEAIAAAPEWDLSSKEEPETNEDVRAIQKAALADFYKKDVTADLVLADKNGKRRSQARKYAKAKVLVADKKAGTEKLLTYDAHNGKYGTLSHQKHEYLSAKAVVGMLSKLGLDLDVLFTNNKKVLDLDLDGEKVATLGAWAGKNRLLLGELGVVAVRSDIDKNPLQLVSSLLKSLGLKMASQQSRNADGTRGRKYWVTAASIEAIEEDSKHYCDKLLDKETKAIFSTEESERMEALIDAAFA